MFFYAIGLALADYNEEVKMKAVHHKSVENNSGVHGRNFCTVSIRLIRSRRFVML